MDFFKNIVLAKIEANEKTKHIDFLLTLRVESKTTYM